MRVSELVKYLDNEFPLSLQESYDNCGLQVGDGNVEVSGVLLAIDVVEATLDEAVEKGCNFILCHHPLIFKGVKRIAGKNYIERILHKAIKCDIAIYAAHTNADKIIGGVSYKMAEKLSLVNVVPLEAENEQVYKVVVYVPVADKQKVSDAVYANGGGTIGAYDCCSFSVDGAGTFKANDGCHPYVGNVGEIHEEKESRVEYVVSRRNLSKVLSAIDEAHPYEEPAIDVIKLENTIVAAGMGVVGDLETPVAPIDFLRRVKETFRCEMLKYTNIDKTDAIRRVALCGGSGSDMVGLAKRMGADIFVTGDVKYHQFFDSYDGPIIADIGHYESEQYTKEIFFNVLSKNNIKFAVQNSTIKSNPINYL